MGHPDNLPRPGSREIEVDRDFLTRLANQMQDDLDRLEGLRLAEGVRDNHPTVNTMGDYSAGQALHQSINNARDNVGAHGGTYTNFLTAYQGVIDALRRSAGNYNNAEDNNRTNTNRVGGGTYAV